MPVGERTKQDQAPVSHAWVSHAWVSHAWVSPGASAAVAAGIWRRRREGRAMKVKEAAERDLSRATPRVNTRMSRALGQVSHRVGGDLPRQQ